jgi:SOS-response transcriptional repressor LexA
MTRPRDNKLSERIYAAAREFWEANGYSPSYEEIMAMAGVSSTSVVAYHLDLLAQEKRIRRTPGVARSIVMLEEGTA